MDSATALNLNPQLQSLKNALRSPDMLYPPPAPVVSDVIVLVSISILPPLLPLLILLLAPPLPARLR